MIDKDIAKTIGLKLREARLSKNISQEQLAEFCSVTPKYISAVECGRSNGSIPFLIHACNALDVSPNFIIDSSLVKSENNQSAIMDNQLLITYSKLNAHNKLYVENTIKHLYDEQKKR